jgi:hypothetical protein
LKAQSFPPFAAAQPESQTRPQEISLFVEGFGKKDTPTAAGKESPCESPAIEQKAPAPRGFAAPSSLTRIDVAVLQDSTSFLTLSPFFSAQTVRV